MITLDTTDFCVGLSDGGDFNPNFDPMERQGDALADYLRGFEQGQEGVAEYYESDC